MKRVFVISPYSGNIEKHLEYLRSCLRDCLLRGETPFAGHGLYTQPGVLKDEVQEERKLGMTAAHCWLPVCDAAVVYGGLVKPNVSALEISSIIPLDIPIEYRFY